MISWMMNNKILISLGVLSAALAISTIVLAIQSSDYHNSLINCLRYNCGNCHTTSEGNTEIFTTTEATSPETLDYRLPRDVFPFSYDLYLNPDHNTEIFSGTVDIGITVSAETDKIILHTKNLAITSTTLTSALTGEAMPVTSAVEDTNLEEWIVTLASAMRTGNYTLSMIFNGNLNNPDIVGFYKSNYDHGDGISRD